MVRNLLLASALIVGGATAASAASMHFEADLTGKNEVPANTTTGRGHALITLDTVSKKLSYTVTFDGLTGPAAAAHFHGPADKSAVAGVAVPIGGANPVSPVVGSATLTDAQIKDLTSGKWYVNVHTAANKPGEIRGQVMKSKD